jgi:hypothetical protein
MSTKRAICTPVDLLAAFNWNPSDATVVVPERDTNSRKSDADWWRRTCERWTKTLPVNNATSWGVPFRFASANAAHRALLVTNRDEAVPIPIDNTATFLCIAHAYEQSPSRMSTANGEPPREGLLVGEYTLRYDDDSEHTRPIRGRYEINLAESPGPPWLCQEFRTWTAQNPMECRSDQMWGEMQFGLRDALRFGITLIWHFALENPHPEQPIRALVIRATTESPIIVAAITRYIGHANPLRQLPRTAFRAVKPDGAPARIEHASVDLGIVERIERVREPRDDQWLNSEFTGVHNTWGPPEPERDPHDIVHVVAAEDATLSIKLPDDGTEHTVRVGDAVSGDAKAESNSVRIEAISTRHQWMTVRVTDETTRQPTPVRIHLSDEHGHYVAPYGHHEQVNTNWFEDYGADVQVGGRNFAYVDGEFAADLPVGDLFIEMTKGYEYAPIRERVTVKPGQKRLDLRIDRLADWRSRGWVTADTHVHFVSPQTAWLEARAEGVNVVNLLASQWGRLFTNVGDYTGRVGVVENDTIVYVGTENRDHMLGHMSMLGTKGGMPVYPMCSGGPTEAYIGDPNFRTLAEWALENRRKGGVVIRPHFPYCGYSEDPVPILLGLVDALEIQQITGKDFPTQEWYRYLNLGYRVAVCGGTDKMSAGYAIGWLRTYAKLDPDTEFTYDRWADAIRAGRTFSTTGPLIDLTVDGHPIGDDIAMRSTGGTVEARVRVESFAPLGSVELVMNGRVVAKETAESGATQIDLVHRVQVERSGWIAARCSGLQGHAGALLAAHTSPVYVTCGDQRPFDGPAAEHFLALVDGTTEYMNNIATVYDEESRNRMVKLFTEARTELRERLSGERHRM